MTSSTNRAVLLASLCAAFASSGCQSKANEPTMSHGTGGTGASAGNNPGAGGKRGTLATGGVGNASGASGSGGAAGGSGTSSSAGSSGASGSAAFGGASAGGATMSGSGGSAGSVAAASGSCAGSCAAPTPTSCSKPMVRVTAVDLGAALDYSTDETYAIPLAIAAKPGGGSLIAWMSGYSRYGSSTASLVHIGALDCDDKLVGTPFTLEAHDFQDLAADGDGGVVVLTRDSRGGPDAQHCGNVTNLCVTPNDRPGCYDVNMVRFDCAGKEQWATLLDTASAEQPGYTSGSGQNYFVWWYQHHGRIAYDGANYAAYFCDAITVSNDMCVNGAGKVDIHEGDRMQAVGPTGELLKGHDSFGLGCSHSWTPRIVWDPRTKHFVTVCATDNNCRIALSPNYKTIVSATCDGTLFGGDVVNATVDGYWTAWSYQGSIKLEHFTTGASDKTVTTAGDSKNPHLVAYGAKNMLLTWKSGSSLAARIYDAGSGTSVGDQFTIAVPDHPWQSWKSFPDGSVAWASAGSAAAAIQIARVMPCSD
jgi:hypothetical protein